MGNYLILIKEICLPCKNFADMSRNWFYELGSPMWVFQISMEQDPFCSCCFNDFSWKYNAQVFICFTGSIAMMFWMLRHRLEDTRCQDRGERTPSMLCRTTQKWSVSLPSCQSKMPKLERKYENECLSINVQEEAIWLTRIYVQASI